MMSSSAPSPSRSANQTGVAPAELIVDDVAFPQLLTHFWPRIHHHLIAVPWLDRGNHAGALSHRTILDLARPAIALEIRLIANPIFVGFHASFSRVRAETPS